MGLGIPDRFCAGQLVSSLIIEDVALRLFFGNIWDTLRTGRLRSLDDTVVPWQPIVSVS